MVWQGVVIEESLEDKSLLKLAKIVSTYKSELEGENETRTFHHIEVDDKDKDVYLNVAANTIKDKWYTHICKDGKMYIVFRRKIFGFRKGEPLLKLAKEYGESIGILKEQMDIENLIDNPYD